MSLTISNFKVVSFYAQFIFFNFEYIIREAEEAFGFFSDNNGIKFR